MGWEGSGFTRWRPRRQVPWAPSLPFASVRIFCCPAGPSSLVPLSLSDPGLVARWPRAGPLVAPGWPLGGPRLVPQWSWAGPSVSPGWPLCVPGLAPRWPQAGPQWPQAGLRVARAAMLLGLGCPPPGKPLPQPLECGDSARLSETCSAAATHLTRYEDLLSPAPHKHVPPLSCCFHPNRDGDVCLWL